MMLILFTVILVCVNAIGLSGFAWIPSLFGVYDEEGYSVRGRWMVRALIFFPVFTAICLVLAWTGLGQNLVFASMPFAYLAILWSLRGNRQDRSPHSRRFENINANLQEQTRELEYKWPSWVDTEADNRLLVFEFHVYDGNILQLPGDYVITSVEKLDVNSERVIANTPLAELEQTAVLAHIQTAVASAWDCGAELESTEVEVA